MQSVHNAVRGRCGARWAGAALVLVFACLLVFPGSAASGETRIIKGYVDEVSGRYLVISGTRYDVAGVPVVRRPPAPPDRKVAVGQGEKVELTIRDGKVVLIRDLGTMLR